MDAIADIVTRLRDVVGSGEYIALHEPTIGAREVDLVVDCLHSGWVSSVGKYVDQFEQDLAEFTGAKYAVAVVNGTAALHACLVLAGVGQGDEVLAPALTFIATANAIQYTHARPHFVDVSHGTLGVCPQALAEHLADVVEMRAGQAHNRHTGARIAAMVPMHTFGVPVEMDALNTVCHRYRIPVVEDAAESLGSTYQSRHTGTLGKLAAVSFNGNKIITAGGGGAILTDDPELARQAKHITTTAKVPHRWEFEHDQVGYNYRMPNLNAALAVAQLERLAGFVEAKRQLHTRYQAAFSGCQSATIHTPPANSQSNYWLNTLILTDQQIERDELLSRTADLGIATRPLWRLASETPMYRDCPAAPLPVSQSLVASVVSLPSSPTLMDQHYQQDAA